MIVPFLEGCYQLIALFSHALFWEKQKFSLSVYVDEKILAFLYERVSIKTDNKIEQRFLSEFGGTS